MTVKTLTKTCEACPAQWEGTLEDGRVIYIRYRWGSLGFGVGDDLGDAIDACQYVEEPGHEFDGELSTAAMALYISNHGVTIPDSLTVEGKP